MRNFSCLLGLALLAAPLASRAQQANTWQSAITHDPTSTTPQSIILAACSDAAGNTVVVGVFLGQLKLGGTVLVNQASVPHLFVARLSTAGQWTQAVAATSFTAGGVTPTAVAVDAAGVVTVAGSFQGELPLGATTLNTTSNGVDIFVARLSAAGQWTLALSAGGSSGDSVADLALAPDGTATLVGTTTSGNTAFGPLSIATATPNTSSGADAYVARLGPTGQWTQALRIPGGSVEMARRVIVDAAGTATVAGTYNRSITLGSTTLGVRRGMDNIFVGRLNAAGQWTQAVRADAQTLDGLAADANGGVVVAGIYYDIADFGPLTVTTPGSGDTYVARLNAAGQWTQAVRGGSGRYVTVNDLDITATGQVILVGTFSSTAQFGTTLLTATSPVNQPELFAAQLGANGTWLGALQVTSASTAANQSPQSSANAVVVAPGTGGITVCGSFQRRVQFGATTLTAVNTALFVTRLTSAAPLAVATASLTNKTALYPNPTTGTATLELAGLREQGAITVEVLNVLGQPVQQHRVSPRQGQLTDQLNLRALPTGVYMVRIHAQEGTVVKRLVKD